MLSHEETIKLILLSQNGDEGALATLIQQNTPLIKSIVKRYLGKNIEYDDLFQIASIGLLKAVKNFSTEYNVRFSTYAVPMILGEIKRQMRDDGYLKVSRSTKSLSIKINRYIEEQTMLGEKEPTIEQIANHFEMSTADIVFAMDAGKMPISLNEKGKDNDNDDNELMDRIPTDQDKKMLEKIILKDMLSKLEPREQKIMILRFYRDMTQGEIAKQMGVSQVQISRLENKILEKLKSLYNAE
ncbi:MAG: SigB/SigF/SigG family RNA polymerase sigma factor [Clostridia bacterium]|nr:SigB/SigF/SigG family RNA polymerase sigma factor [Clostridia bacterium]MBQ2914869.1 SigB/SigF/SigG family RNA polymerase sigma factor [Clostridia bacterium]MBQ4272570.1 SigB/SigF/SigG family RNA polymerase sigma factor [Clostridia bacterium]